MSEVFYKCEHCALFIHEEYIARDEIGKEQCPKCNLPVSTACKEDRAGCIHQMAPGIAMCPVCGDYICPVCGAHGAAPISRVTGYMQDVNSWNAAKRQELKDRVRFDI